jgi:hypothetical protein
MAANQAVMGTFFIVTAYILRESSTYMLRNGLGSVGRRRGKSGPGGQYRLRDEGANDKHDESVKGGAIASVFVRTCEKGDEKRGSIAIHRS